MNIGSEEERQESGQLRLPLVPLLASLVIIIGLSVALFERFGDFRLFLDIVGKAEPWWLVAAVVFQMLTYVANGQVWNVAVRAAKHPLRPIVLARLAIERLTIDQFMPSAGVAGHLGTLQGLRHFGVPTTIAMEALFIDLLAHYSAYATAVLAAFVVLLFHHDVTPVILLTLGVFAAIASFVLITTVLFLQHRDWIRKLPRWLSKRKTVARLVDAVAEVSSERILAGNVFFKATFFHLAIFILDGATLWAAMRAVGVHASPTICFTAFIIATVAGTVLFIPGGVGVFEVGSVTTLVGFGIPFEGALAGTLLLRGLTLWIPLIPGSILAHQDLGVRFFGNRKKTEESIKSGS
ncbi:MAG: lysylphosphatidylglycerol synthase transmembrane domain-containing protein [Candidatus Moraniibacteriota bacterium]